MYVSNEQLKMVLEDAYDSVSRSDRYMEYYEEEKEHPEIRGDYYVWSIEYDMEAKGTLRAYRFVTGRVVTRCKSAIKREMEWLDLEQMPLT